MHSVPDPRDRCRFYETAAHVLRALDARAPVQRRFGADADARWQLFRGDLTPGDRLDLVIRDAAETQPAAFAPRMVFALDGLADDEPFGPDWPEPDADLVHAVWKTTHADGTLDDLLGAAFRIWGLAPTPPAAEPAPDGIRPADRLLIAGAAAIRDVALAFDGRSDLDIADQVTLIADHPGERQAFGVAVAWLEPPTPACVLRSDATDEAIANLGRRRFDRAIVSPDASDAARHRVLASHADAAR